MSVRDALDGQARHFRSVFQIRPGYNPLGALDFTGCYDERSDRRQTLLELLDVWAHRYALSYDERRDLAHVAPAHAFAARHALDFGGGGGF